jgi:hypothetical protein
MHLIARLIAGCVAAVCALPAQGATRCAIGSDALTRPLVELYTSEGCDSCPPADRWLAANFAAPERDVRAVALAFHVDYWNRLGWVDRFASPAYTERQYAAMRANHTSFVYTPQVLVQGHDHAAWRQEGTAAIDAAARVPSRATLSVEARPGERYVAVQADAQVADPALRRDADLFVAYVDGGLVSQVSAGENRGVRLAHERVVRTLRLAGTADQDGRIHATFDLERPHESGKRPMVVAFVQRRSNGDVLQTVALPLDACGS